MALARKVDRLVREKKMVVAESHVSTSSIEGDVRTLVRSNRSRSDDIVASNDAIAAGAASIADIEGLAGIERNHAIQFMRRILGFDYRTQQRTLRFLAIQVGDDSACQR